MDESLPYRISYATGAEQCKKCRLKIDDGSIQIAIMAQSSQEDVKFPVWYHRNCFLKVRLPYSEIAFDGFALLRYGDQMALRNALDIEIEPQAMSMEDDIRKQNEQYFAIYDYIVKNVSRDEQFAILMENGQTAAVTQTSMLHPLSEIICFGVLEKCPKCKSGDLRFSNWCYRCSNPSPWSTFCHEVHWPQRFAAKIPANMLQTHSFLEKNKGVRQRVLHTFKFFDEDGNDLVHGPYKKRPLINMEFSLIGDFTMARADMERTIKKMGGKIATRVHDRLAAVISNAHEVQKMDRQMMDARMYGIQVVSEDFLRECQSPDVDPVGYILSESICDWGGYVYDRIVEVNDAVARMEAELDDSMQKQATYKWKSGAAVDPKARLGDNVHVYSMETHCKTVFYSVTLGYVDILLNKNSYYRLQLLESSRRDMYWLFESWGRTGTTIGSTKLQAYHLLQLALNQYNNVYESKTGNKFNSQAFKKHPKLFYKLDIDMELPFKASKRFNQSNLSKPVYDLMDILFDIQDLQKTTIGCDLNVKEMPLGKISADQIRQALAKLKSIYGLIQQNAPVRDLIAASNEFYTLLPHACGVNCPPIIRSIKTVIAKSQFLENLSNYTMMHNFLDGENPEFLHPYDLCYHKLHASIEPIEKHSANFQQLCDIIKSQSPIKVLQIFKVQREAEIDRNGDCHINFKFRNHQLLWHGSRLSNFTNILCHGLRISPAEALANGDSYGNGVYFSDSFAKAASYCRTDPKSNVKLMILCEVALGIPKVGRVRGMPISWLEDDVVPPVPPVSSVYANENSVIYLPNDDFQSIQAFPTPNSIEYQEIDGIRIANGRALNGICNEFIVFDPNQIKIKYLFQMKF